MRYVIVFFFLFFMLLGADAAKAGSRVAFVVGNGAYKNTEPLPNAPISAKAMADLLRKSGFKVVEGTDLTRDRMTQRLLEFGRMARGADLAVFYYAGHGITVSGTGYLLPVDADVKSEMDVKLGSAIDIDLTLDQVMSDAKVKLAFLDASRNDPFAAATASAQPGSRSVSVKTAMFELKPLDNSLTAFATGPGQTAPDGPKGTVRPFTHALIENIAAPGVEIQEAMTKVRAEVNQETDGKQTSWGRSNLTGPVYLDPHSKSAGQTAK
jgi:uncharacterized caspase-like protein